MHLVYTRKWIYCFHKSGQKKISKAFLPENKISAKRIRQFRANPAKHEPRSHTPPMTNMPPETHQKNALK